MNIYKTGIFPYIEGGQLNGRDIVLTIRDCRIDKLPGHDGRVVEKPVLIFQETPKLLILNKTNAKVLARLFGPETKAWSGRTVALYAATVKAFGAEHSAVRIRPEAPKAPAAAAEPVADNTAVADANRELFND